jgi:hypothetical protein
VLVERGCTPSALRPAPAQVPEKATLLAWWRRFRFPPPPPSQRIRTAIPGVLAGLRFQQRQRVDRGPRHVVGPADVPLGGLEANAAQEPAQDEGGALGSLLEDLLHPRQPLLDPLDRRCLKHPLSAAPQPVQLLAQCVDPPLRLAARPRPPPDDPPASDASGGDAARDYTQSAPFLREPSFAGPRLSDLSPPAHIHAPASRGVFAALDQVLT